jgi:hypothetical protein
MTESVALNMYLKRGKQKHPRLRSAITVSTIVWSFSIMVEAQASPSPAQDLPNVLDNLHQGTTLRVLVLTDNKTRLDRQAALGGLAVLFPT